MANIYEIFEGNMDRLEKKLTRIANKCKKYGCDFRYEKVGEIFRKLKDDNGREYTARFIQIEAEGKAIINDWRFIASVEHTENGNIIKKCFYDVEIPEKYYVSKPICDHCGSNRYRKNTYIVQNLQTGEFKQVGKSCLADFTNGISAEYAAHYISLFDTLIEGEYIEPGYRAKNYIEIGEALRYVSETTRHFGYVKADGDRPTKYRAKDYYEADHRMAGLLQAEFEKEMWEVSFNANSDYAKEISEKALKWVLSQEASGEYMHNLKTVCSASYVNFENFGILASLIPSYNRAIEREQRISAERNADMKSEHIGKVGDRITILISDCRVITSWETQYGITAIYKITDESGNVFTWKTSRGIVDGTKKISATIKSHNEYNGTKQTEITRCRVVA